MFKPVWVIAKRELLGLASEKTLLLAILLQLFIAGFSSFVAFGLVSLYDPEGIDTFDVSSPKIGIVGYNPELVHLVREADLRVKFMQNMEDAEEGFYNGSIDAILFISGMFLTGIFSTKKKR